MTRYFIFTALLLALLMASPATSFAGTKYTAGTSVHNHDDAAKGNLPAANRSHQPVEKAHSPVPSWDELAHIHHFHKHRLKKMKQHYRKTLFLSKLFLLICHAAVLFISYLHVTH